MENNAKSDNIGSPKRPRQPRSKKAPLKRLRREMTRRGGPERLETKESKIKPGDSSSQPISHFVRRSTRFQNVNLEPNRISGDGMKKAQEVIGVKTPKEAAAYKTEIFNSGEKGQGIRSLEHIKAGSFVCEYGGELMTPEQAADREQLYANEDSGFGSYMYYFKHKRRNYASMVLLLMMITVGHVISIIHVWRLI